MNKTVYLGLSVQKLSTMLMQGFDMIKQNQNLVKNQNCVIWIQTVSLYNKRQMMFIKILQKMLILDLIPKVMNQIDHCLKEKIKK